MTDEQLFLQLMAHTMRQHGASVSFSHATAFNAGPAEEPPLAHHTAEAEALKAIAAALREDTRDFECIDKIIDILESLGYTTLPRHDFG